MRYIAFCKNTIKGKPFLSLAIDYIKNPVKTKDNLVFCNLCSKDNTYSSMRVAQILFRKTGGREYVHFFQSFHPLDNVTPEQTLALGKKVAEYFKDFQYCVAVHTNTNCLHYHVVVNSVNPYNGKKLDMSTKDFCNFWRRSYSAYIQLGLPRTHVSKHLDEWLTFVTNPLKIPDFWKEQCEADDKELLENIDNINLYDWQKAVTDELGDSWFDTIQESDIDNIYYGCDDNFCSESDCEDFSSEVEKQLVCPITYINNNEPKFICPIIYIDETEAGNNVKPTTPLVNYSEHKLIRPIVYIPPRNNTDKT